MEYCAKPPKSVMRYYRDINLLPVLIEGKNIEYVRIQAKLSVLSDIGKIQERN